VIQNTHDVCFVLLIEICCQVLQTFFCDFTVTALGGNPHLDFSDVCAHYLGRWAEILSVVFSLVALVGGAVVYWVLMSNFLFHTVTFIHGLLPFSSDTLSLNVKLFVILFLLLLF